MSTPFLLHHLIDHSAVRDPHAEALVSHGQRLNYAQLKAQQDSFAAGLAQLGLARSARVGIYLAKSSEAVLAAFGAAKAGACFVPINPVLKAAQVTHILLDCDVRVLVTSRDRYAQIRAQLDQCPALREVIITGSGALPEPGTGQYRLLSWAEFNSAAPAAAPVLSDIDMAAILYTSGSTGRPKGVVISHRNLVSGAQSVASYLENKASDRILALLPLSFDAGFSQLTTAFLVGACALLHDFLMPSDILKIMVKEGVTGLTAVPPLWIQLSELDWPAAIDGQLRYFANTGGKMPREILARLRARAPSAKPYLMYGLTEAFRSTYLSPEQVDQRPDSIGKAIPNQEVLVLRPDGQPCGPNEPGELVHRGSTVSLGYWNDPLKTAERFRLLAPRQDGLMLPEYAVFSGDTVSMDAEGFLYFIGRKDEMIKSSGYRISPVEVEEAVYATGLVQEVAALGLPDERLGQAVALVLLPKDGATFSQASLLHALKQWLPVYMLPQRIVISDAILPRNGNGKIDRKSLAQNLIDDMEEVTA